MYMHIIAGILQQFTSLSNIPPCVPLCPCVQTPSILVRCSLIGPNHSIIFTILHAQFVKTCHFLPTLIGPSIGVVSCCQASKGRSVFFHTLFFFLLPVVTYVLQVIRDGLRMPIRPLSCTVYVYTICRPTCLVVYRVFYYTKSYTCLLQSNFPHSLSLS